MIDSYDFSQDTIITLILKNLISRTSVEKVTNDLMSLMNKEEDEITTNNTLQLTNYDILSIVYKLIGSDKLLKILLSEIPNKNSQEIKQETEIKKEEALLEPKFVDLEKEKEKLNVKEENEYSFYLNGTIPTKIEKKISSDNIIIEIPTDINQNKNEMEIDENETSSNEIENIRSEVKLPKYKNNIGAKNSEIDKRPLKSEVKIAHSVKEHKKDKDKQLSNHYTLNQGKLYKFRYSGINKKKNVAYFSCYDLLCQCFAEYNLKNKIFTLKIGHTLNHDEHNYIKEIDDLDLSVLNHMKDHNLIDIQIKK